MTQMKTVGGALVLAAMLATGCAATQKGVASLLISDQQEAEIGKQVKTELETKQNIKYVQDPEIVAYVNKLALPILQSANAERKVAWKLYVLDDPKMVNAFATPGGYIYVYTGLLLAADNDAEIAGVMGHEAGHVTGRHSARALVNQYGLNAVLELALGKNPGLLSQLGAGIAGQGVMLANSRSNESEADESGAIFSNKAGYDPRGLASFFAKLKKEQGNTPAVLAFLSTHPDPGDRVKHVNEIIQQNNLRSTGGNDAASLERIKARIRALPAQ